MPLHYKTLHYRNYAKENKIKKMNKINLMKGEL
jgi:hypothetical protein